MLYIWHCKVNAKNVKNDYPDPTPRLWQFGLGPPGVVLQEELESVQKRAARFLTGNYNYETGSMTGIHGQLKWESLKKRRKDNRLILLYKGLK